MNLLNPFRFGGAPPPAGDPTVLASVTGASGSVYWLGETWNLPADSGQQRAISPTFYFRQTTTQATPSNSFGQEYWQFSEFVSSTAGVRRLTLKRQVDMSVTNFRHFLSVVRIAHSPATPTSVTTPLVSATNRREGRRDSPNFTSPSVYFTSNNIFIWPTTTTNITPFSAVHSGFFKSYTVDGITYEWQQGTGW